MGTFLDGSRSAWQFSTSSGSCLTARHPGVEYKYIHYSVGNKIHRVSEQGGLDAIWVDMQVVKVRGYSSERHFLNNNPHFSPRFNELADPQK